jgi:hypothetical protein
MPSEKPQIWLPVALIAGALILWMGILAFGAYSAPTRLEGGSDPRKLWVVAATTGAFLLLWGGVLMASQAKRRRKAAAATKAKTDRQR